MYADPRTLLMAAISVSLFLAILSFVVGRANKLPAVASMGVGVLFLAAGFTVIALRGVALSERSSVYAGGVLTLLGTIWLLRVARTSRREPTRDPVGWTIAAVTLLGMIAVYETPGVPNAWLSTLHSVGMAVLISRAAWLFASEPDPALRAPTWLTVGVLALTVVMLLARGVLVLTVRDFNVLHENDASVVLLGTVCVFVLGGTFGVVWLELARLQADLTRLAATDPLTGLRNRRSFAVEFERETSRSARSGVGFSVALFDLDRFKGVNDRYGHLAGDEVLRAFARVIDDCVRNQDLPARYGGEEFVVLLAGAAREAGREIAERIRRALESSTIFAAGAEIHVTASAGVAAYGEDGKDFDSLLHAADTALYAAKAAGRNIVLAAGA
jgi:diguanylate cyclase (GGDEF)-like protein